MAGMCEKTGAKVICSLEQIVYVLLNDKGRRKGDVEVRFRERFEVRVLLLTRLRGRRLVTASYSIKYLLCVSRVQVCKNLCGKLSSERRNEGKKIMHATCMKAGCKNFLL